MEPGIFPEPSPPRHTALKSVAALVAIACLLLFGYAGLQIRRLVRERDRERARVDELLALLKKPEPSRATPASSGSAGLPAPQQTPTLPREAPSVAAVRAPDVRVVPPPAKEVVAARLDLGLSELKTGRYPQAELHFFRALPDGYLYLMLSSLGRDDLQEAASFLGRAGAADPAWFRKAKPRELLSEAEFERILKAVEARVRENPLDGDAKLLLSYLHFHEKGPAYAKALLLEVVALNPEHAQARQFLEGLDK